MMIALTSFYDLVYLPLKDHIVYCILHQLDVDRRGEEVVDRSIVKLVVNIILVMCNIQDHRIQFMYVIIIFVDIIIVVIIIVDIILIDVVVIVLVDIRP